MARGSHIARRYRALLTVNQIATTESTINDAFQGMCAELRKLLPYDRAGLTLYDAKHDSLRIESLYGQYENSVFEVGGLLPRKHSHNGLTFDSQRLTRRRDLAREFQFPSEKRTLDEGYRSLCSVPLIYRKNSLGVVTIVGARKNQFSVVHGQVLQELSNQITTAIAAIRRICPIHLNTNLICPKCLGAAGGRATVSKHRDHLSEWGKKGGRGKKLLSRRD